MKRKHSVSLTRSAKLNASELLSKKRREDKSNCNAKKRSDNVNESVVLLRRIQMS